MPSRSRPRHAALLAAALFAAPAQAVTFKPAHDDQVLEVLPRSVMALSGADLLALKAAASAQPQNVDAAVALARRLTQVARQTGDPRLYGQAQAALAPWWDEAAPPAEVLLLRATIEQFGHAFPVALKDLGAYLAAAPGDLGARLMQANICVVTGDAAGAAAACAALPAGHEPLISLTCQAAVDGLTGKAEAALATLAAATAILRGTAEVRAWALATAADLAERVGKSADALAYLQEAHRLAPNDVYTTAALADVDLDRGDPAAALAVVKDRPDQDALLVRQALAEQRLGLPPAAADAATLAARFAAERARGTMPHLREEAYFTLRVRHDAPAALALATENYQTQREAIDARLLHEAQAAAGGGR